MAAMDKDAAAKPPTRNRRDADRGRGVFDMSVSTEWRETSGGRSRAQVRYQYSVDSGFAGGSASSICSMRSISVL
jgi:hypothetical protein